MKSLRFYITALFVLLISFQSNAQADIIQPSINISGEVAKPLKLYGDDISKIKHVTAMVIGRDGKKHIYSGVPVQTLLELAGVTTGKDLHGENLSKYLLVKCADGYEVLFSLAEVDSSFTDKVVLLADTYEGKPITGAKGPFQLAVGGDKKPARSCFQVTDLMIKFAKE